MNVDLLYYNPNPSLSLAEKVAKAAIQYRHKYGNGWPDTCYVHPCMLGDQNGVFTVKVIEDLEAQDPDGPLVPDCLVRVLASPNTLCDHFWIGRREQRND